MCNDIMTHNEVAWFLAMLFFFGAVCFCIGVEYANHKRKKQLADDNTIVKWTAITDAVKSSESKQMDLPL